MQKSAIIQKIKLSAITRAITSQRNASGSVQIEDVTAADGAKVMNPNGRVVFCTCLTNASD